MPITLNCPKCRKPFRVRDESVGMRVKCPTCAAVLQVPASLSPASVDAAPPPTVETTPPPPPPAPRKPPAKPAPAKTGRSGADSFLDDLPEPSPHAGPPSLPIPHTQPMKPRREEPDDRDSRGNETGPLPSPRKPAAKPKAKAKEQEAETEDIVDQAAGWRKVRKGLGWIRLGLFLSMLPAIGNFAVVAYAINAEQKLPESLTDKGFLGKGLNLWQELELGYALVIPVLAYLLVLIGRAGCTRVPESARTRGTAGGLLFLTFISFAAFATFVATIAVPFFTDSQLPKEVKPISWTVFIYFGLLTEAWFLIFLAQAGVPLRSTRTLRDTALSLLILVVLIAGVQIANGFYPLLVTSPKMTADNMLNVSLINAGVFLVVSMLFVLRMISVTNIIRRAITRWMEENKDTLEAAPD